MKSTFIAIVLLTLPLACRTTCGVHDHFAHQDGVNHSHEAGVHVFTWQSARGRSLFMIHPDSDRRYAYSTNDVDAQTASWDAQLRAVGNAPCKADPPTQVSTEAFQGWQVIFHVKADGKDTTIHGGYLLFDGAVGWIGQLHDTEMRMLSLHVRFLEEDEESESSSRD